MEIWIEMPGHLLSVCFHLMDNVFEHFRVSAVPQLLCIKSHFQEKYCGPGAEP